ncbi:MAG: GGDEF domain-containing protein [Butyrivibrio sp.]|nr:GGDEF domain-containing protein [Butyrivibrio sp.]
MQYNYYFDIYALLIIVSIMIMSIVRRKIDTYQNIVFNFIYLAVFVTILSERIETYMQMHPDRFGDALRYYEYLAGSCYYIFHLLSGACLLMYVIALLNFDIFSKLNLLKVFSVFFVGLMLVVANVFTPILFYYDYDGAYHRADYQFLYYVLAGIYFVWAIVMLIRYRLVLHKRNIFYLSVYMIFVLTGIFIQFLFPHMLVEEFFNAISLVFAFATIESPGEILDESTDLYNRRLFVKDMQINLAKNFKNPIIFVSVDIIENAGIQQSIINGDEINLKLSKYLRTFENKAKIYRVDEAIYALIMKHEEKSKMFTVLFDIAKRLERPWNIKGNPIDVDGCVWYMDYPKHYSSISDLAAKVGVIAGLSEHKGSNIVYVEDIDFDTAIVIKNFDKHARMSLANDRVKPVFQPAYSNTDSDILIDCAVAFSDENGEYRSGTRFIKDDVDTKALSDTDVYCLKEAGRFLKRIENTDNIYVLSRVSRTSLMKKGAINKMMRIIEETNVSVKHIILRVSETAFSTIDDYGMESLKNLNVRGYKFLVDRFGIGYSDLNKIISFNTLGVILDHELIDIAITDDKLKAVVISLVNMLHDVSLYVFAEFIDTQEEAKIAAEVGCDYVFGTYYSEFLFEKECIDKFNSKEEEL